jgi:hypothetical protein
MAKAGENNTPRNYDEDARMKLKRHLERVFARRRADCKINWDELWNDLETAARAYTWSTRSLTVESSYSPGDTLVGLDETRKLIDVLVRKLNTLALFNWNVISDSTGCLLIKYESPTELIGKLTALRDKLVADAEGLRKFITGQRVRVYNVRDCTAEFKGIMLEIGQKLLGSQKIGRSDGPLITFLHLALLPVLGDATPDADALRVFARRHSQSALSS